MVGAGGMLHETGWGYLNLFWVQGKLYIFTLLIIPIEVLDLLWGQIWPARLMKRQPEATISPELRKMFRRYDLFTKICIPFLLLAWAAIFYPGDIQTGLKLTGECCRSVSRAPYNP